MPFSAELFSRGARDAEKILQGKGFTLTRTEQNNSFGSHHAKYTKADEKFVLLWDGKEEWLRLITKDHSGAEQDLLFRWLRSGTDAQHEQAMHDALENLQNYFSQHTHDDEENCCSCSHHHT